MNVSFLDATFVTAPPVWDPLSPNFNHFYERTSVSALRVVVDGKVKPELPAATA
jgi:hypothetical protein